MPCLGSAFQLEKFALINPIPYWLFNKPNLMGGNNNNNKKNIKKKQQQHQKQQQQRKQQQLPQPKQPEHLSWVVTQLKSSLTCFKVGWLY